ncbi:MAG: single-stranded DNA-binding protein [Sediminibacterium sp.]|nr:single-stranded DNA-binding protein [Sediminibacterium sp.]
MLKLSLIGFLGANAETKEVKGDKLVTNFNVCISEKIGDKETQTWVSCSKWTNNKEEKLSTYLVKGVQVYLEGKPEINTYKNKEGEMVSNFKLTVAEIKLLSALK